MFWEDKIFLSKMFAKLIVSFILIYLYVCVVLHTSIQSYFYISCAVFLNFYGWVCVKCSCISILIWIHLKITEPISKLRFSCPDCILVRIWDFQAKSREFRRDWDGWTVWKLQCTCSLNKMPYRNNELISCQLTNNNHCYNLCLLQLYFR